MIRTALINSRALLPTGWVEDAIIVIEGDRIASVYRSGDAAQFDDELDLDGALLVPGFFDIQVNGGGGILFNDDPTLDAMSAIADAHRPFGTTRMMPTLISDDLDKVAKALSVAEEAVAAGLPGIAGVHIEGPFLNLDKRGIHDASKIRVMTEAAVDLLLTAKQAKVIVTLAPDCADLGLVRRLVEGGVRVSAGHTNATYDQTRDGLDAGVSGFTHLFNAMSPLQTRAPGMVAAALESLAWCGMIVDGKHVHPAMLRLALRAKRDARFLLVTDAMPCVGAEIDHFYLGDRRIEVRNGTCVSQDGTLAGASLTMIEALKNTVSMLGVDLADAIRFASAEPAAFLGLEADTGSISAGLRADFVVLSGALDIVMTIVDGVPYRWESVST